MVYWVEKWYNLVIFADVSEEPATSIFNVEGKRRTSWKMKEEDYLTNLSINAKILLKWIPVK
jgi:hypothetical protein